MIIVVDGMDGAGKTTIAQYIASNYNFKLIDKPNKYLFSNKNGSFDMNTFNKLLEKIYEMDDMLIKTWFFCLGNIIATKISNGQDVVIDRHFASNYFWNSEKKLEKIYKVLIEYIGVPDMTFLVKASSETRKKRILKRNPNDNDLLDNDKFLYGYDKMEYFLKKFENPYLIIDTDYKNKAEVCYEVKSIMDQLIKKKVMVKKK